MRVLGNSKPDLLGCGATAARRAAGNHGPPVGPRRAWNTLTMWAILVVAAPAAAQDDCDRTPDWTDIAWFRNCIDEQGREEDWATEKLLGGAARLTDNPAIIQVLLQAGADPQRVDDGGLTSLHHGARNSNPVITAHLLAAGADPNALDNEGYTPLHQAAAASGAGRVVARLLGAGADPQAESNDGRTPLHSALRYAAVRDVTSALVRGGGADHLTPLQLAALEGDAAAVTSLLAEEADPHVVDGYGWGSLHFAVPFAGPEVVSALLRAGTDANAQSLDGLTALHLAARHRTSAVVSDLLRAGADPNAAAGEEEAGGTPLHVAVRWNDDPSVVFALLEADADPNLSDGQEWTPLHFAAWIKRDDPSVVLALLEAGANPSPASADDQGWIPLHLAAWVSEVPSVVLALLDGGADPAARDEDGRRPVDFARANDAIIGSSAYPRLLVPRAAGRLGVGPHRHGRSAGG